MKTIKQITAAILIISAIVSLSTCKKIIIQTDKPLEDVLMAHVWKKTIYTRKKRIKNKFYYHFLPDSICLENFDIEDDSLNYTDYTDSLEGLHFSMYLNFKERWWIEYRNNNPILFKREIFFDPHDSSTNISDLEYRVKKYDEYKIKAYLILAKPEGYPIDDSVKAIFKAVN